MRPRHRRAFTDFWSRWFFARPLGDAHGVPCALLRGEAESSPKKPVAHRVAAERDAALVRDRAALAPTKRLAPISRRRAAAFLLLRAGFRRDMGGAQAAAAKDARLRLAQSNISRGKSGPALILSIGVTASLLVAWRSSKARSTRSWRARARREIPRFYFIDVRATSPPPSRASSPNKSRRPHKSRR